MFRCEQCETEFGGIRGVSAARCPRCAAKDAAAHHNPIRSAIGTSSSSGWLAERFDSGSAPLTTTASAR